MVVPVRLYAWANQTGMHLWPETVLCGQGCFKQATSLQVVLGGGHSQQPSTANMQVQNLVKKPKARPAAWTALQ
jgi:hypothetical protein